MNSINTLKMVHMKKKILKVLDLGVDLFLIGYVILEVI